jgi:hypothetical protein
MTIGAVRVTDSHTIKVDDYGTIKDFFKAWENRQKSLIVRIVESPLELFKKRFTIYAHFVSLTTLQVLVTADETKCILFLSIYARPSCIHPAVLRPMKDDKRPRAAKTSAKAKKALQIATAESKEVEEEPKKRRGRPPKAKALSTPATPADRESDSSEIEETEKGGKETEGGVEIEWVVLWLLQAVADAHAHPAGTEIAT